MTGSTRHPRFPLVPGLAGGLGPYAHLLLERRLLELCVQRFGAGGDGDFPDWVVSSMPQTPDRTEALAGRGPDPTPFLLRTLERLRDAGADFAAIACNTIHAFLPGIAAGRLPLPVVHVVCETVARVRRNLPAVRRIGLLATDGTCRSGLFAAAFAEAGLELICPPGADQDALVTAAIYGAAGPGGRRSGGIKGGQIDAGDPSPRQLVAQAADAMVRRHGAEAIVVACSELSLALPFGPDLPADGRPGDQTRAASPPGASRPGRDSTASSSRPTRRDSTASSSRSLGRETTSPIEATPIIDTMDVLADAVLDLASGRRSLADLPGPADWPTVPTP